MARPPVHRLVGPLTDPTTRCGTRDLQAGSYQAEMVTCPACRAEPTRVRQVACLFPNEKTFQDELNRHARALGWQTYHPWRSDHSADGFPDTILLKAADLLAWELKMPGQEPTPAQQRWLTGFAAVTHVESHVWTPEEWDTLLARLKRT
jgi:hypothetical protein